VTVTPNEAEVISDAMESALIDVHTALPGKVVSYSATTQRADIELQVKRALPKDDGTYTTEALPVLKSVPVAFMRGGGQILSLPLAVGNFGLVVFSEMSLDQWLTKGTVTSPGDIGRHTLTGGVFYPGLSPVTDPVVANITNDGVMGPEGAAKAQIRTKGATVEIVTTPSLTADDFVAMAGKVQTALDAIIDIFTAGTPTPHDGGGALQTAWKAAGALIDTDVASSNLKADD
jgi:hypothetical protein